ncbi:addiction module antidote protein [Bordetella genomosp. 5]|uniref:Addiction module antidote protein n=1 Tax=Bordetella genomosp. 5 TaxID=1395608 RepID=A0A261SZM8_9BORD|nr:addiction module antidote protein [Bordetella genomosp. 5]OZI33792.1 addiction module antidote protein [Bordetella genomosp. 5]OZI42824.1 addiction module antidote protein [Bordetella genomosp. 5]
MKSIPHDEAMAGRYRDDPAYALAMLDNILESGEQAELLITLRQLAQACGGMQSIADRSGLNLTQLYRTLSPKGNPGLSSLTAILHALGLRLAVRPLDASGHYRLD